jgi:RND superfamily putative drug exporter
VTKVPGVANAFAQAAAQNPRGRYSDYFTTHNAMYLSPDRHTAFAEIFPAGNPGFDVIKSLKPTRATLKRLAPAGTQAYLTGHDPLYSDSSGGDSNGPSVLLEALIGGLGALIILLFVFGTLPAIAMPLFVAVASILNTFTLVWALTYVTDVSLVVEFLIALVGLGIAIDYALLMIFRFREELRHGNDVETSIVTTMTHAGRSVIVSGSTVAVGLLSMLVLPLPFIRSIGIGGMLIPAVSVLAAITLLPAMLAVLGTRINSARVLPRRIVEGSDNESVGFWNRWSRLVTRKAAHLCGHRLGNCRFPALLRRPAEPERSSGEGPPRRRGRDQRARRAHRSGCPTRRLQAVRDPRRRQFDPGGARAHRRDGRVDAGRRRRGGAGAVAHVGRGDRGGDPEARRRGEGRSAGHLEPPARRAAGVVGSDRLCA